MGLVPGRLCNVNLGIWKSRDPNGLGKRVPMYTEPSYQSRMVHGVMVPETTVIYLGFLPAATGGLWYKVIYGESMGWIRCELDEIPSEEP